MNLKKIFQNIIDVFMIIIFSFMIFYNFTGEKIHKLFGMFLLFFIILHIFINLSWYKNLFKGKYTFKRIFKTITIFIILNIFIILFFTGIKILQCKSIETPYKIYSDIHFYSSYLEIFFIFTHLIQTKK